ncbi:alpha/beta fold hydrolase [Cellulomonas sp. SG140]|uniref:alpha/beta fold hydrolase n=1 Tax=Cellulomonas sp. SG140 TaxID=2976536 RepID=UPI0021E7EAAF|nr:alpha/beta hydrolase [Cellulomonas sp. SG140]
MTNHTELLDRPEGRIAYTVEGPADGPLVVLVPGMGDLRGTWRDLVTPLVAAGYRTAVTDLRGHGDSDTTFRLHGDLATGSDVIALVEHLGGPAVLIGSSMGAASVAWVAAERPDLVAGLVLSGPLLRNPPTSPLLEHVMHAAYRAMFVRPWGAALWASYYRSPLSRGRRAPWFDEHLAAIRTAMSDPAHLRQFRRLTLQLTHAPVEARLGDVHAPVLAFIGRRDPDLRDPAAEAVWIEQTLDARTVFLDDAAHYPHHQAADDVAPATLGWLAERPRDASGRLVVPTRGAHTDPADR